MPESDEFASNVIKNRSDNNKTKSIRPQIQLESQNAEHVPSPFDVPKSRNQMNDPTPVHHIWGVNTDYSTADISQFQPIRTNSLVPVRLLSHPCWWGASDASLLLSASHFQT